MELLLLTADLNQKRAARSAQRAAAPALGLPARRALPTAHFFFVSYDVRIEADEPLYFLAEATND
jgi:hypothetical protein